MDEDNSIQYINIIPNIEELSAKFTLNKRLKIDNFLDINFAESIYRYAFLEKNWVLASGIDKNKYEKKHAPQFDKINQLQIKNVSQAFGKDQFSYVFYRGMNSQSMSLFEFKLRKILNSELFLNFLNNITGLELKQLTTMFMSKYNAGNFLSTHSDKGNGKLAFVINLTKYWKPQYGGNLHFLNDSRTEVIDTYVPGFNNLVLFHVPEENGIPHYVGHVAPNVKYSRFAISGWYN